MPSVRASSIIPRARARTRATAELVNAYSLRPGSRWQAQHKLHQQISPKKGSTRNVSPFRHANFTIRNLTRAATRIIECSTMSVITVKRVIKRTPMQTSRIRRSFVELTRDYFAHESRWQFAIEALLFAILLAISAWPILAAVEAVNELLQRTSS